jgi:hypothetical protein
MKLAFRPSKIVRQVSAVALLFLVLAAGGFGAVLPLVDHVEANREARESLKRTLDRYDQAARDLPRLQARLVELQENRHSADGYLTDANETLATASLQSRIKSSVLESGGQLFSMENLSTPKEEKGPQKVAVRARAAMGLAGLQQVLVALNETQPVLLVDALEIRASESNREAATGEILDVDFTVYGYLGATE